MSLENIIRSLENGLVPVELDYRPREEGAENIDWNKVLYNLKYHQPEFYEQKLPKELKNLPCYDEIINLAVETNKKNSPLFEILQKQDKMIALQEAQENLRNIHNEPAESDQNA